MKFFIPNADTAEKEKVLYRAIKAHLSTELDANFNDRKV